MTCPKCGEKSRVVEVATDVDEVVRLRKCKVCNYPFYTAERDIDPDVGNEVISRVRRGAKYTRRKEFNDI